jgi:hypothetical protein
MDVTESAGWLPEAVGEGKKARAITVAAMALLRFRADVPMARRS